mmetsp:Transcript_23942/g.33608  ORF Transcript_23942/g.33608 Transcript_23942/m.33608 type:complete len:100 (-) Transcript_23942:34-333(-)
MVLFVVADTRDRRDDSVDNGTSAEMDDTWCDNCEFVLRFSSQLSFSSSATVIESSDTIDIFRVLFVLATVPTTTLSIQEILLLFDFFDVDVAMASTTAD